jgi:predicted MFS family arabinose efflux permease
MTTLGGYAASFMFLALTRFGVAFGEAGALPAGHALIVRRIEPERRGLAIGLFAMGIPLGTMVGFAVGGAIADVFGWRIVMMGAGAIGVLIGLLTILIAGPTPQLQSTVARGEPFLRTSLALLSSPAFRWMFTGAIFLGFAGAPFYAFSIPFLIRTYGFTATEVGVSFGMLQGVMGIIGTLGGGRWFDHAVRSGTGKVLGPPAILFLIASVTTTAALFAPVGWMSIALFVPGMLSFSFFLPWGFGAAHLVAGPGRQAQATSLVMIGTGLVGPALGPLFVGIVSDVASAADIANGLGLGMLIVPLATTLTGIALLIANQRVGAFLRRP